LKKKIYKQEVIADALKRVAQELYGRQVTVTFPKRVHKNTDKPLRFVVSCERGDERLEVFPVRLER
jgi:hypothetical protein